QPLGRLLPALHRRDRSQRPQPRIHHALRVLAMIKPRGSTLLLVLIIIATMGIIGLAIIQRGISESDSMAAKRRYDKGVSCADAARELLIGQFRTYSVAPTSIQWAYPVDDQVMATGHYDSVSVKSVVAAPGYTQAGLASSDISNRIIKTGLGGQVYR